jgi:hypothetical protein
MKVFISQPMRGRSQEQILEERQKGIAFIQRQHPNQTIEILDTYFKDFTGNRLEFLGKSIAEGLAKADRALFLGNYEAYDGCVCEHVIAKRYGIPTSYFSLIEE